MEELVLAAQSTHFGFQPIGKNQKGVVIEQMGYRIQIICIVIGVGILDIHVGIFQLNKKQRNTIDKTYNISSAAVEIPMNFQFPNSQKVVLIWVQEVNHLRTLFLRSASRTFDGERNSIPDKAIFFLVDLHQGGRGKMAFHLFLSFVQLGRREPRVQAFKSLPKIPGQQDILVILPPKGSLFAQFLSIIGIGHLPAQLLLQQVPNAFLDEDIFGVVVAHIINPPRSCYCASASKRHVL